MGHYLSAPLFPTMLLLLLMFLLSFPVSWALLLPPPSPVQPDNDEPRCNSCSNEVQCVFDGDNLIGLLDQLSSECSCQTQCSATPSCSWYTWYDYYNPIVSGDCYLWSSCPTTAPCSHCYSGPTDCTTTTTTTATTTTTTTPTNPMSTTTATTATITTTATTQDEVIFLTGGIATEISTELLSVTGAPTPATIDLPGERYSHTSHLLSDSILVCGGVYDPHSCISTLDPVKGPWTSHSTTAMPREYHSGVLAGNALYLLAGVDEESQQTTEFLSGSTWYPGPDIPYSVRDGSCSVSPSPTTIIITGGADSPDKVSQLDITTGTWTILPDLPRGRFYHGCTVVTHGENNKKYLVAAGGLDGSGYSSTDILDLGSMTWITGGEMNQPRSDHQIVMVGNKVLILGGYDGNNPLSTMEQLSLVDWTWSMAEVEMGDLRYDFSAVVVHKEMVSP